MSGHVNPTDLLAFIERVENVNTDVEKRAQDRKVIFDQAKEKGINTKLMRRLIAERKKAKKANAAEEAQLDAYRDALVTAASLVKSGLSLRQAAKQAGVSKSSVHRALAVPAVSHDPETGEITETQGSTSRKGYEPTEGPTVSVGTGQGVRTANSPVTHSETADRKPPGDDTGTGETEGAPAPVVAITESCGGPQECIGAASLSGPQEDSAPTRPNGIPTPQAGVAPGPQDPWTPPPFLRRKVAA